MRVLALNLNSFQKDSFFPSVSYETRRFNREECPTEFCGSAQQARSQRWEDLWNCKYAQTKCPNLQNTKLRLFQTATLPFQERNYMSWTRIMGQTGCIRYDWTMSTTWCHYQNVSGVSTFNTAALGDSECLLSTGLQLLIKLIAWT